MTQQAKRVSGVILVAVAAAGVVAFLVAAGMRSEAEPETIREIVLEARGTSFDGDNPTLVLRPGERVRVVVRNDDPGVEHSIAIPELGIERRDVGPGEQVAFEVEAPQHGVIDYVCPQHLPLMKGKIVVQP
jgi:plastocyanin